MDYYEKNGHTAFRSNSGTEYYLPESSAFEDVPHFKLKHRNGTNDCRCLYECDETNGRGERLEVELTFVENFDGKARLPRLWLKEGRVDHILPSYWVLNTYVYDERGRCFGAYNPQEMNWHGTPDRDGHVPFRRVIDYEWKADANHENALALLSECHRRFMAMEPTPEAPDDYFD